MKNETPTSLPSNPQAVISLTLALLTILSFCTGMVPIPFTGLICFPLGFFLGALALIFGLVALEQIRRRNEPGSPLAWTGIIIGGFVVLCMLCIVISFASLFIFAPHYIPNPPPFLEGYQL